MIKADGCVKEGEWPAWQLDHFFVCQRVCVCDQSPCVRMLLIILTPEPRAAPLGIAYRSRQDL